MNEDDSKVYLSILTSGSIKVSDISKLTGINRTRIYVILENLSKLGALRIVSSSPLDIALVDVKEFFNKKIAEMEKDLDRFRSKTQMFIQKSIAFENQFANRRKKNAFKILKDRSSIVGEVNKMMEEATESIDLVIDIDKFYLFDNRESELLLVQKLKDGVKVNILTGEKPEVINKIKPRNFEIYKLHIMPLGALPNFIVIDKKVVISLIELGDVELNLGVGIPYAVKVRSRNYAMKMVNVFTQLWEASREYYAEINS